VNNLNKLKHKDLGEVGWGDVLLLIWFIQDLEAAYSDFRFK
jgi:hypothetical protein